MREGEIVTLIGANGAGKSTTLKTISGQMRSRTGSVTFLGQPIRVSQALSVVLAAGAAFLLFYNIKIKKRTADGLLVNQLAAQAEAASQAEAAPQAEAAAEEAAEEPAEEKETAPQGEELPETEPAPEAEKEEEDGDPD